jgi:GDP-D-mannose 3', 5'-epimerase
MKTALVCGAGGFIGSHLVKRLKSEGYWVRGVDLKYPEFSKSEADEFLCYDLRDPRNVEAVMRLNTIKKFSYLPAHFDTHEPFDEVYQLAADMGGAGYIFTGEHDADIMHNSAIINLNVCEWAVKYKVGKVFYSSSACMYPQELQWLNGKSTTALKESDAYPGNPDSEYGWEKLFSERLYLAYNRNHNLNVRIARFHNIYGPEGNYKGGKEKAPAAMCRKVIEAENEIEVWGTGQQTRSFLYIDDCIDAVRLFMESDSNGPLNIGSEEMITINGLAQMAIDISGKHIDIKNIEGPVGVMGRNSDNTLIRKTLGWEPKYSLREAMYKTFEWIKLQYDV